MSSTKNFPSYIDRGKCIFYDASVDWNYEITLLCSELMLHKQIADGTPREEIIL